MNRKEHIYSVLIVSSSEKFNNVISAFLPESKYTPIKIVSTVNAGKLALTEREFDYVIINAPLPDDIGMRFAIDICTSKETVALYIVRAELHDEIYDKVYEYGVFTLPKPTSKPSIINSLNWMASARERLRRQEKKTLSIEEKMKEIRLVNKAKWLLISELKMTEENAHRYIEKQAMDRCVAKKLVAEEIIRTYS